MGSTSATTPVGLTPATITFRNKVPFAPDYGDVYFSTDNGLAESRHVFIDGNDLRDRFASWPSKRAFVIGETGFGTGRNMLLAWQTFREAAPANARLHLVSIERHPLCADALTTLWTDNSTLAPRARRLIECWPVPVRGIHRIRLSERVTLDLCLNDIDTGLTEIDAHADAWFLDGFAPTRNPAMWTRSVFDKLATASRPGATFATYSCARRVREHAADAGFTWQKRPGAGSKRAMLCGRLEMPNHGGSGIATTRTERPWFTPPAPVNGGAIAVIGAGIAGTCVAEALARRGWPCDVYDPQGGPGGASGNAQGALYVRPAANNDVRTRFQLAALAYTRLWLGDIDPARQLWSDCGLLQLACDDKEWARQQRCITRLQPPHALFHPVDASSAATHANLALAPSVHGGLFFPNAGWVKPEALCRALLAQSGARVYATAVTSLEQQCDHWRLDCNNGHTAEYAHVVLACASQAANLCADLPPMQQARGQITAFSAADARSTANCVVCGNGYVMPPHDHRLRVGASFRRDTNDATPWPADDEINRDAINQFAPALAEQLGKPRAARAATRCGSYDRLPFVGPVPDSHAWRRDYAELALDARRIPATPGTCWPGLWASLAHGANGLVTAPLAAEALVSRILDEPAPLPVPELDALHPGRWLIRELLRGR